MIALSERNVFPKNAELHLHTDHSDGKIKPQQAVDLGVELGLSALVVTDHDRIAGAEVARDYATKNGMPIEVFVGAEVTITYKRHVLAIGVNGPIEPGKSLRETVASIRQRGGAAILAHPLYKIKPDHRVLRSAIGGTGKRVVDGWEVYNAALDDWETGRTLNQEARVIFEDKKHRLGAPTAGSDNHYFRLGRAVVGYEGDLVTAIKSGKVVPLRVTLEEDEAITDTARRMFGEKNVTREFRARIKINGSSVREKYYAKKYGAR